MLSFNVDFAGAHQHYEEEICDDGYGRGGGDVEAGS